MKSYFFVEGEINVSDALLLLVQDYLFFSDSSSMGWRAVTVKAGMRVLSFVVVVDNFPFEEETLYL